jgi:hypothetical protein
VAQAIAVMLEKQGIACDLMHGFHWDKWTGELRMTNLECRSDRTSDFALPIARKQAGFQLADIRFDCGCHSGQSGRR